MLIPSIFAENLFDDFMRFPFEDEFYGRGRKNPAYTKQEQSVMKTDVREKESFYVGEGIRQEDIHAKFENGILKLSVPKLEAKQVERNKFISIEG